MTFKPSARLVHHAEVTDKAPFFGWTKQTRKNQALLRAVAQQDINAMQKALDHGAELNAKSKLVFTDNGETHDYKGSPLSLALSQEFLEGSQMLLALGAYFSDRDIDTLILGENEAFMTPIGLTLVDHGWDLFESPKTSEADFSAYDQMQLYLVEQSHPQMVQSWRDRFKIKQEKQYLQETIPEQIAKPTPQKMRL